MTVKNDPTFSIAVVKRLLSTSLTTCFICRLCSVSLLSEEVQRERSRQTHQVLPGAGRPHAQQEQGVRREEARCSHAGTQIQRLMICVFVGKYYLTRAHGGHKRCTHCS